MYIRIMWIKNGVEQQKIFENFAKAKAFTNELLSQGVEWYDITDDYILKSGDVVG